MLVLTEDNRLYGQGRHKNYSLGYENRNAELTALRELTFFKCRFEEGEHIVDMGQSKSYMCFVTNKGRLFCQGYILYR